jgi:cob(I)alamin adenosyltransferase
LVSGQFVTSLSLGALLTEKVSIHDPSPSEPTGQGLVQVFTGDGKGKTSAALGVVLRALGHGLRVFIVFFMKGDYPYGEFCTLAKLPNVDVASFGFRSLTDPANIKPKEIEQAKQALATAREAMLNGNYDLVVLDEVNVAAAWKLIEVDEVARLIREKPRNVELILTGRHADAKLIELADLVTEMVKIKHPYDKGVSARKGIEY